MTTYKLTYFGFDGGRGEPIRIACHAAGLELADHRISFDEFRATRNDLPFTAVPVLYIDGVPVTQSNSINRYIGKKAGLYPDDDLQALYCDEVMDAIEDLLHYIVQTFGLEGDALKAAREKLVDGWLSVFIRGLDRLLARGGGKYFADDRLTMADLKMFVQARSLMAGTLDHVPEDLIGKLAPALVEHKERIEKEAVVVAYYESRKQAGS
ncbi:MAG: glutathione S-transferase family protein [Woeseiaceae bacterium]|nr:glutathione S-transferase family protein [Woeseiaceae bacterium]